MSSDITGIDFFCGAGGSSSGLVNAGIRVVGAANHWQLAIETHNTNHPTTEHFLDDLQRAHPSQFPRATIAWFSPVCANHSLAKGRKRKGASQMDLWGEIALTPDEIRSRATMREVVEFTEFHRYEIVIVENVVDIRYWEFYDEWLTEMVNLGYDYKTLYLNAQFFGVPQSRDRFYAVFWKRGNRAPNLDFRPPAICPEHGQIGAVQVFKKEFHWGRYGKRRQYVYRCPQCGTDVMLFFRPAADVIDWSIASQKIGERKKPLKDTTIARILAGLRKFGSWPSVADLAHNHAQHEGKVHGIEKPLSTQTTRQTLSLVQPFIASQHLGRDAVRGVDRELPCITTMNNEHSLVIPPFIAALRGEPEYSALDINAPLTTIVAAGSQHYLVQPPFIVEFRKDGSGRPVDDPLATIVASGLHHMLVTPFLASVNYFDERNREIVEPLPTQTTANKTGLVTPPVVMSYYGSNPVYASVNEPLPTMRTVSHEALITPEAMLPECGFRMLEPQELKRGMSFPDKYIVLGDKRNQVKQIGNAVACNVAQAIAERCVESLQ